MPLRSPFACLTLCAVMLGAGSILSAADKKEGGASQYDVPEGTPEELLAFIKKLQEAPASGERKERMEHLRNSCQAIVTAAEQISAAKADDETHVAALKAELEALALLKRLGDNDAGEKLDALSAKLETDKRPAVARLVKLQGLSQRFEKLEDKDPQAAARFAADLKKYAGSAEVDVQLARLAQMTTVLLYRAKLPDEAAELAKDFFERTLKSENTDVQMASAQFASLTGQILEAQGREAEAGKFYREAAQRLAKLDQPGLSQAAEQFEQSASKLAIIGQAMPISGQLLGGGEFDASQFKGKVVLVDFWATWCGPCVAELPNVKEVYEKYHDRGFEVVGISLDNDVDDLNEFIKDKKIAWPILFEGGEETSGWSHPLAKKYGVNAIPMAVLVDRKGKVVTISARGERLMKLVGELIDVKQSAGKGGAKKSGS